MSDRQSPPRPVLPGPASARSAEASTSPSRTVDLRPESTLEGYDRWAAQYDGHDNPMVAATAWALSTRPLAVAGHRVVELGCGTGRHAPLVLAGGATSYTGVDGSAGMLAVARRTAPDPRLTWVHGDVAATGLPPASFDTVLVVLVLEHQADLGPLFREAARLSAPGARLRLLEIHADLVHAGTHAHFVADGVEHRFASVGHTVAAIVDGLEAAGFSIASCHEHPADGELLAAVPRLGKHRGRRVLLDLTASR